MCSRRLASVAILLTCPESWDKKAYKCKIVESIRAPEVTELDEYVFVVRILVNVLDFPNRIIAGFET